MYPDKFKTIAADFGTPAYIYSVESVRDAWRRLSSAFTYRPIDFHYAIVCNKNPYLVREIVGLGAGIHANTPGDAYAALQAGVSSDRIVYSGTNLDAQDMEFLVSRHIKRISETSGEAATIDQAYWHFRSFGDRTMSHKGIRFGH